MLQKFFEQLSLYYCKENDLSNVTVALCNSNESFKEKFVRFFFPHLAISDIELIKREQPDENGKGSRVDIFIQVRSSEKPYLIEVKIADTNHHFGQYEEAYDIPKGNLGYITNYDCVDGKALGYDVKCWEDLYDYLSNFSDNDEMIMGYLKYLQSICNIVKYYQPMNIIGLNAIPCFLDTTKKIITLNRESIDLSYYRQYCYRDSVHSTFHFSYPQLSDKFGFAAFGIWFQDNPIITIGITSSDWLSAAILKDQESLKQTSEYATAPYKEHYWKADDVWFDMRDDKVNEFIAAQTYEEQYDILLNFFEEVMNRLAIYFR